MTRFRTLLLSLLVLAACRGGESPTAGGPSAPQAPVVIISIDTLRADHLPAYGYKGVETPAIDGFRKDAVMFANAYSHCPMTLPSHVSILTGLLPTEHGVRNNLGYTFDRAKHATIAQSLKQSGYATGAAVSAYVLRAGTGLGGAFDFYEDTLVTKRNVSIGSLSRDGDVSVQIAQRWVDQHASSPFFFMLHLFEPHAPYAPREPYKSKYSNAYDGEIASVDEMVGGFLQHLKSAGIYDRALIIVLSDHGEGLGDHGEGEHGVFLYREAIHVPLLVKLPKSERGGTTVDTPVQLIDIAPTIASIVGVKAPGGGGGTSLFAVAAQPTRRIYSETFLPRIHFGWSELRSLVDGQHHYIQAPRPELYDVRADPAEKVNVLTDQRRVYAEMRKAMEPHQRAAETPLQVDPEEAKKLAALGYVGSVREAGSGPLPDPKDHIAEIELMRQASQLESEGALEQALAMYERIASANPQFLDAWIKIGTVEELLGRPAKAEAAYAKAISVAPALASGVALQMADLQFRIGRSNEAEAHARLAVERSPGGAHLLLAKIAKARGDAAGAEREARAAMEESIRRPEALIFLARLRADQGRLPDALTLLEQLQQEVAAGSKAPVLELHSTRGDVLARMDRFAEAEKEFQQELIAFPTNLDAYSRLAIVYVTQGRMREAEELLELMYRNNPRRAAALVAARTWEVVDERAAAQRWRARASARGGR